MSNLTKTVLATLLVSNWLERMRTGGQKGGAPLQAKELPVRILSYPELRVSSLFGSKEKERERAAEHIRA